MSRPKDLTGQRFGRLTAIRRDSSDRYGLATWLCRCDCGSECVVRGTSLTQGNSKSCGCLAKETVRNIRTTHKKSKTRLYNVWASIKERCTNPVHKSYRRYGGRGITICDEWRHNFQAFYDWAIANGYNEKADYGKCTIDRVDNDKGYSPDNCRWVDMKVQNNNKSSNRQKGE